MKMNQEEMDILDSYLRGELNEDERAVLDDRLKKEPDLRAQLEIMEQVKDAASDHELKQKLDIIHEQTTSQERPSFSTKQPFFYWAAASIALVTLAIWLMWPPVDNKSLAREYLEVYDDYLTSRSSGEEGIIRAMALYNTQQFEEAVSALREVPDNRNADVSFYLGLSFLYSEQFDSAQFYLQHVIDVSEKYDQQSRWFLALSYLSDDEAGTASILLNEITAADFNYKKSQALLEELTP